MRVSSSKGWLHTGYNPFKLRKHLILGSLREPAQRGNITTLCVGLQHLQQISQPSMKAYLEVADAYLKVENCKADLDRFLRSSVSATRHSKHARAGRQ